MSSDGSCSVRYYWPRRLRARTAHTLGEEGRLSNQTKDGLFFFLETAYQPITSRRTVLSQDFAIGQSAVVIASLCRGFTFHLHFHFMPFHVISQRQMAE